MSRVLVTGASGFVGGHLAKHILDRGNYVVSISHDKKTTNTAALLGIEDRIDWAYGDITNSSFVKRVVADYEIEQIYHLAALPIVRVGTRTTIPIFEVNIMGSIAVFEAAKEQHLSGYPMSVMYMATDKVYGDAGPKPYNERDSLNGLGVYEASKACADLIARSYHNNFGLKMLVVRPCNIYGTADLNSRLIPNTIRRCMAGLSPVVYKGITYVREFIYTSDVCEAMILLMENIGRFSGQAFNIGTGVQFTQQDIIGLILKYFPNLEPTFKEPQPYMQTEIPYQVLDATKISDMTNWRPKVKFEEGLEKVVSWWQDHKELAHLSLRATA